MQPHPSDTLVETVREWLPRIREDTAASWGNVELRAAHAALSSLAERLREAERQQDAERARVRFLEKVVEEAEAGRSQAEKMAAKWEGAKFKAEEERDAALAERDEEAKARTELAGYYAVRCLAVEARLAAAEEERDAARAALRQIAQLHQSDNPPRALLAEAERFARAVLEGGTACEHTWVDMRNALIESGEWCPKCGAVRAGNAGAGGRVGGDEP